MKRYAALLRGVSPMNAKMSELVRAFEAAGFAEVKTVLASGNVIFSAAPAANAALERKAQAAMSEHLKQGFRAFVRPIAALQDLLEAEPYAAFELSARHKRVVTFLPAKPKSHPKLPIALDTARILAVHGSEVLSAYVPSPRGPVFMSLLEKTFGKDITTRTWDTVAKIVKAAG